MLARPSAPRSAFIPDRRSIRRATTLLLAATATLVAGLAVQPSAGATAAVVAPALEAVSVDPTAVQPGGSAQGTVTLDVSAASGGTTVGLTSDDAGVHVPDDVLVEEDQTSASFPVTTDPGTHGTARITATVGEVTRSVELVVADSVAPETTITRTVVRHRKRSVTIRFGSSEAGSTFLCRLDQQSYRPCASPRVHRRIPVGRHIVRVKATDVAGNADPTPALDEFHVRR